MKIVELLLCMIILPFCLTDSVISSMDFTTNIISAQWTNNNAVGVATTLPELLPYLNNSNSIYGSRINLTLFDHSYNNIFYQVLHVPKGYKYNCSSTIYGVAVSCTLDLSANSTLLNQMLNLMYNYANYGAFDLGYDIEKSNFTSAKYFTNFRTFTNIFSTAAINIELIDYGDQIQSIYNGTYTVSNYLTDISTIQSSLYYLFVNGPGLTQAADSSWVSQISQITWNYNSVFTFRCIVFKNSSQATIANLLSDNYTIGYLKSRMVDANNKTLDFTSYPISISDIRLTNDSGVNGVTNSFAAALWALDISMQFAALPGFSISFYNPLTPSYQSVFGAGPNFQPGAIYYGLSFALYALRGQPYVEKVIITSGSSQNIKAFGLDLFTKYRILLINKDLNQNLIGVVNVKHSYPYGLRCYYLSAPYLNSTSNITFAGMYFVGNNSNYVGQFQYIDYMPSLLQIYAIKLNYSQAVLCQDIPNQTFTAAPRGRSKQLAESALLYAGFLLMMVLALM